MQTPPSPALSLCDTFSSPDLDAYLDSLSPLSSLPSPTMKEAWWKEDSLDGRQDSFMCAVPSSVTISANTLCNISACVGCSAVKTLPSMVAQFLDNSRVPMETIALTYNILSQPAIAAMHCWHQESESFSRRPSLQAKMHQIHGVESDASCQRALVILSALSVAVSFMEDRTRNLFHWSRQVADGTFSTEQIGSMNRMILAKLEWKIHPLTATDTIASAMRALSGSNTPMDKSFTPHAPVIVNDDEKSLRLLLGSRIIMQHGLLTPEPSPDCVPDVDDRLSQFMPITQA